MRARDPRCARRSSLPAVHPRAPSLPTDSPFRMSHCCASRHWRKKSPTGAAHPQSEVHNKHVEVFLFNVPGLLNHGPSRLERECALARGNPHRVQPCERQMCLQDVPRDWVCNPSSPLLPSPSPFLLSWLMITRQQTAT